MEHYARVFRRFNTDSEKFLFWTVQKVRVRLKNMNDRSEKGVALVELIIVVFITLIIGAIAVPKIITTLQYFRTTGELQDIASELLVAKMRASSDFTRVRVRFDLTSRQHRTEIWQKGSPGSWNLDAPTGIYNLAQGVQFGVGSASGPPSGTQATLGQAPTCKDGSNAVIANTACIIFNSRGAPVDDNGAVTSNDAIYINDGSGVYGITFLATGQLQRWRIDFNDTAAANWGQR